VQEWQEYLNNLLSWVQMFDRCKFSSNGEGIEVPPIIKATILMLNKMILENSKYNIIVLPETSESTLIFTIANLLFSVERGLIKKNYNPKKFIKDDNISYKGCIVKFLGYEEKNGENFLCLKTSDLDKITAPIEMLPIFNRSTAKRL